MKLNELIIKLVELQNKGYGDSPVYYEAEEQYGDVNGYIIERGLEDDWVDEIYLRSDIGDME